MTGHAPGVLCRVKPPKTIPKWEYDQVNERIVQLVRLDPNGKWEFTPHLVVREPAKNGSWLHIIQGAVPSCLVPINPGDGQDEILRIVGLPNKEHA